jgi:hypothetical protein
VICIDSDIFLIDLRYRADKRAERNRAFLNHVRASREGVTTLFNLLEVAGVLSFSLSARQLSELCVHFPAHYGVQVLPSGDFNAALPVLRASEVFEVIRQRAAFGDAMITVLVNRLRASVTSFVSWNARHFEGRIAVPTFTPATFPFSG